MSFVSLSIISATLNSSATISTCLNSIQSQSVAVEHIIKDGGSTDGTIDIVKQHSPNSKIISEPDKGIYDALNKGIESANGDVIGILHADDFFASTEVLEKVAGVFSNKEIDSCYGDLIYVADEKKLADGSPQLAEKAKENALRCQVLEVGGYDPQKFYWGWMPPHPIFFVRREVYEKYGLFNLDLGTATDYELMLRFLLNHKYPVPISLKCL